MGTVTPPPVDWPGHPGWKLTFHWAEVNGVIECVGIDVRSFVVRKNVYEGQPQKLTTERLRKLRLADLVAANVSGAKDILTSAAVGIFGGKTETARKEARVLLKAFRNQRRTDWTDDALKTVAALYREAKTDKIAVRPYLAEKLHKSEYTIDKMIRAAREAGLLESSGRKVMQARKGRKGKSK